jgi:hypothetical protein
VGCAEGRWTDGATTSSSVPPPPGSRRAELHSLRNLGASAYRLSEGAKTYNRSAGAVRTLSWIIAVKTRL